MNRFPRKVVDDVRELNPSIRLFGRRFSDGWQPMNALAELLLVAASKKRVLPVVSTAATTDFFPDDAVLNQLRQAAEGLVYYPKAHLNLKLFAFFGASDFATRHRVHQEHARKLRDLLGARIYAPATNKTTEDILQDLSALFLGFLGNGAGRAWCAQTFLPFSPALLANETIWRETQANRYPPQDWDEVCHNFSKYFETNQHRFLDRSGESLYLQLCNAFSRTPAEIKTWLSEDDGVKQSLLSAETDPPTLKQSLSDALRRFLGSAPRALSEIINFIDTGVETETAKASDGPDDAPRKAECGWVPEETWREGYLFAVEIKRLLSAKLDPMEKLDLFEAACSLQILRTLVRQAGRHYAASGSGLRLLLCDADGASRRLKTRSSQSLQEIAKTLKLAIRIKEIQDDIKKIKKSQGNEETEPNIDYSGGDDYGIGLYRKIGRSLGLIVPPKGRAIKATLNERLLRCLVLTLVPEQRATLVSFKARIEAHHGFIFDPDGRSGGDAWLERLLEAAGMLVRLSDACSLVHNPFVPNLGGTR